MSFVDLAGERNIKYQLLLQKPYYLESIIIEFANRINCNRSCEYVIMIEQKK